MTTSSHGGVDAVEERRGNDPQQVEEAPRPAQGDGGSKDRARADEHALTRSPLVEDGPHRIDGDPGRTLAREDRATSAALERRECERAAPVARGQERDRTPAEAARPIVEDQDRRSPTASADVPGGLGHRVPVHHARARPSVSCGAGRSGGENPAMAPRPTPFVAVLAGGSGTRFWPAGRRAKPKQALALDGDDPLTLLAITRERVAPLVASGDSAVFVAPKRLRAVLDRAAPGHPAAAWLFEPAPRNTAAAVALIAFAAHARDPDTSVLVVPADQHVSPLPLYRRALRTMLDRARTSDALLTLGISATRPATGYGYLRVGEEVASSNGLRVHRVERFLEKPNEATARRLAKDGRHLWNGGTFAFRARVFLDVLRRHLPDVHAPVHLAFAAGPPSARRPAAAWKGVPSISVDHGVMEHAERVEVVAAPIAWDDLGSWDAVARGRREDGAGNRVRGDVVAVDASGCLVDSDGGLVALLGVEDLIVVRTKDAVLVAKRGRGEDVRELVARLREQGRDAYL